ncbi:MAG: DUF2723 domain-containing protein [Saprospiraceae bacterium]
MFKRLVNLSGWLTFAIATIVYYLSAERVGSLWDCGEFVSGAYKLEVVHPPGAPLFLLVGRIFTVFAEMFSNNPESIAFSVNLMSGICTAFAAAFVAWSTIILGKLALKGRDEEPEGAEMYVLAGAGLIAGLSTAFATSIWFSAVEGEVYAMSTMFTAMVMWAVMKWYNLPDNPTSDRWLVFAVFAAGLSIGVHLLSILTFPALALFYYYKKYKNPTIKGMIISAVLGVALISIIQIFVIIGIPTLWSKMELLMVNSFGLPFHSGLIPTLLIVGAVFYFLLRYAHQKSNHLVELLAVSLMLVVIGFSTIGIVVIRANANPPINMNDPSDAMRLLPYLNREQYGERPLLSGPTFEASPSGTETSDKYGRVGDKYEVVDEKISYKYKDSDKMFFSRMGDPSQGRPDLYRAWVGKENGKMTFGDNLKFLFRYQVGWMYFRYFFWNFVGRQNGDQGLYAWEKKNGNWMSGIKPIDEAHLYNLDKEPESLKNNKARNLYFGLPLIFGLFGLFYHFKKRQNEATALMALFIITGLGIIIYSNQPPNEPRERDYVLVGSFFTFCMWIGMGAIALYEILKEKANLNMMASAGVATLLVFTAPLLMGTQNFDDHDRSDIKASRDYATNFLNSCEENAIIFTYGDNDTYPLWYAQEVEGIRTDVRVVNLSLIAVDWYINQLRRKVNDSPAIKMTVPAEAIRGKKRNSVLYYNPGGNDRAMTMTDWLTFIGEDHQLRGQGGRTIESYFPSRNVFIPIDKQKIVSNGVVQPEDAPNIVDRIDFNFTRDYYLKDDIAILDIINSNLHDRPVYFAVTCRPDNMFGLQDYMQLEGLALRVVPLKNPSDKRYSVMGNGKVATDIFYDNVENKFNWGNFDKKDLFVNHSYGPSVQSHRITILRAAEAFMAKGQNDKAIDLADKYFEGFPEMNFPYDYNTMLLINVYVQAGAKDKAKIHLKKLAIEVADYLDFLYSLDQDQLDGGSEFARDLQFMNRTREEINNALRTLEDEEFAKEIGAILEPYNLGNPKN